jgi:hypothetical protein
VRCQAFRVQILGSEDPSFRLQYIPLAEFSPTTDMNSTYLFQDSTKAESSTGLPAALINNSYCTRGRQESLLPWMHIPYFDCTTTSFWITTRFNTTVVIVMLCLACVCEPPASLPACHSAILPILKDVSLHASQTAEPFSKCPSRKDPSSK